MRHPLRGSGPPSGDSLTKRKFMCRHQLFASNGSGTYVGALAGQQQGANELGNATIRNRFTLVLGPYAPFSLPTAKRIVPRSTLPSSCDDVFVISPDQG